MQLPDNHERKQNRRRIALDLTNYRRILALRNRHRGKQCIVVATGPSINAIDLALIENHPFVLGVNAAFRIRSDFHYYFCSCPSFYLSNELTIEKLAVERFFFSSHIPYRNDPKRIYLKLHEKTRLFQARRFQSNLFRTLYWGPTVLLDLVIPAALWMGFAEIILLGADYSLKNYRHFYPEQEHNVLVPVDCEDEMVLAHAGFRVVSKYLRKSRRPAKIINCSPLSDLTYIDKADLETVVRSSARG